MPVSGTSVVSCAVALAVYLFISFRLSVCLLLCLYCAAFVS